MNESIGICLADDALLILVYAASHMIKKGCTIRYLRYLG